MPKNLMAAAEFPFIIKVCGITREDDLEASVEAGANAIGFNFYPKSPRFLSPMRARRLAQLMPGAFMKVGVFVNPSEDELLEIAAQVPLDVMQLHGDQLPANLADSFRVWRGGDAHMDRTSLDPAVEAWLLDTPTPLHGGSGRTFDWSQAVDFPGRAIVAGGLDGDNVAAAIQKAKPWGVDACSRLESSPGQKDPALVKLFVENALAEFRSRMPEHTEMHS